MMQKLFKRKMVFIPLIAAALGLIIASTVFATTMIIVPGKVNVIVASYDIQLYSNASYTQELTSVTWTDLVQGADRSSKTIYIKNTGNTDITVTANLISPPEGLLLKNNTIDVPKNGGGQMNLTLGASSTTTPNAYNLSIEFESAPVFANP